MPPQSTKQHHQELIRADRQTSKTSIRPHTMHFTIKLVTEAVAYLSSFTAHQQPLSTRLTDYKVKYITLIAEVRVHNLISRNAEPIPKALLEQVKVANQEAIDLYGEAGCQDESVPSGVCASLTLERLYFAATTLIAEWDVYEKEQEAAAKAGSEAEKDL